MSQQRERLDVRGVRKHVHHTRRLERKAMLVHQHPQIPREASRVTGNIQHALRRERRQEPQLWVFRWASVRPPVYAKAHEPLCVSRQAGSAAANPAKRATAIAATARMAGLCGETSKTSAATVSTCGRTGSRVDAGH